MSGGKLDVVGGHAALLQVLHGGLEHAVRSPSRGACAAPRRWRRRRVPAMTWSLIFAWMRFFVSRSTFWRISARMRATSPSSTPRDFANSASTVGSFGSFTWFTLTVNSRGLALQVLDVVLGEDDREGLLRALGQPDQGRLEVGEHAALAQRHGEVLARAALEGDAVDLALEIDVHEVALGRAALDGLELGALLAQRLDGRVDLGVRDFRHRARHLVPGEVAHGDLGIDLEDRLELERRRVGRGLHGLEARHAGHAVVLGADGLVEEALDASPRAPPGAPGTRSGAPPS